MSANDKTDQYIKHINGDILPFIDYAALQASYDTDMIYAKGVLNWLHKAMIAEYGCEHLDENITDDGFVVIPGVVCGRETGKICLALLDLDLSSSGEHWGTAFLCKFSVVKQGGKQDAAITKAVSADFVPYDYGYTASIPGDIHVDRARLPEAIKSVLSDYRNHSVELIDGKLKLKPLSTLDQIRDARKAPKEPRKENTTRNKREPEH